MDLGLAVPTRGFRACNSRHRVMGTVSYMAPEQAMVRDRRRPGADLYALGVIAYRAAERRSCRCQRRGADGADAAQGPRVLAARCDSVLPDDRPAAERPDRPSAGAGARRPAAERVGDLGGVRGDRGLRCSVRSGGARRGCPSPAAVSRPRATRWTPAVFEEELGAGVRGRAGLRHVQAPTGRVLPPPGECTAGRAAGPRRRRAEGRRRGRAAGGAARRWSEPEPPPPPVVEPEPPPPVVPQRQEAGERAGGRSVGRGRRTIRGCGRRSRRAPRRRR